MDFSETYEMEKQDYVRNTRPKAMVHGTEGRTCDEEEVAQEVILPGESAVVTTMLTEKEKNIP